MRFEFSRQIFEKTPILNFMKIRPVVAVLFRADRQTEGQTNWLGERQIDGWT